MNRPLLECTVPACYVLFNLFILRCRTSVLYLEHLLWIKIFSVIIYTLNPSNQYYIHLLKVTDWRNM